MKSDYPNFINRQGLQRLKQTDNAVIEALTESSHIISALLAGQKIEASTLSAALKDNRMAIMIMERR